MLFKLWLFHVHTHFQNPHLSSSFHGHFHSAAQVHITIPHLLTKQNVAEILCVHLLLLGAQVDYIFQPPYSFTQWWTRVILVCHFKTQLLKTFHTQYLTFLIFIQQINGDTGHGLSKKI